MASPYDGLSQHDWPEKTKELIQNHPLKPHIIRKVALDSWESLWETTLGSGDTVIKLAEIDVPAPVVGYFFEKLFAKRLQAQYPEWRGGKTKEEKDIVCETNLNFSIEIKISGQENKIFGNRSYGQKSENESLVKKEKSGYYITVNFYKIDITLLRFGWIDHNDWNPQGSSTGQSSALKDEAYKYKLFTIPEDYILNAPVGLLCGVGEGTTEKLTTINISTIRQLSEYNNIQNLPNSKAKTAKEKSDKLRTLCDLSLESEDLLFKQEANLLKNVYWLVNSR